MLNSKKTAKKNAKLDSVWIGGILMKPDWQGTFMSMGINQKLELNRQQTTQSRLRPLISRLNSLTGRRYTVTVDELDEKFTVRREA